MSNPEEVQICIPYKYMVKQLKSLKKNLILAAILDTILGFQTRNHELKTVELLPNKVVRQNSIFIHFMDKLYNRPYVFSSF